MRIERSSAPKGDYCASQPITVVRPTKVVGLGPVLKRDISALQKRSAYQGVCSRQNTPIALQIRLKRNDLPKLEPKTLTRYGNDVPDLYLRANQRARQLFEHEIASRVDIDPKTFTELTNMMHHCMAYKDGDVAGKRRTGPDPLPAPPRGKGLKYVALLDEALGLGFGSKYEKRADRRIIHVEGVEPSKCPAQKRATHIYPAGDDLDAYYESGANLLSQILKGLRDGEDPAAARQKIGSYYHVMVNARPYTSVNNSMFMNQVNCLLEKTGHPGLMHGDLDFAFTLIDGDDAQKLWTKALDGKVPTLAELTATEDNPDGQYIAPQMKPKP